VSRYLAVGKFNPYHLNAFLPLTVDPARQSQAAEFFFIELAVPELADFALQINNVFGNYGILNFCPKA